MHLVPFIYFSLLTGYFWHKNRSFDVAAYMSSLYVITSLCAAIIVTDGHLEGGGILFEGWEAELGVIPTLMYCALITITIIPFSFIRVDKLEKITDNHRFVLFGFVCMMAVQALLNLYLVADSTVSILSGDLKEVREMVYNEEMSPADIKAMSMPAILQYLNYTNNVTLLAIPLFFYYSCVKKYSLWLTTPLLFISLSPILKGMQLVDRTEIMNYGLIFGFCLVFFKNMITRKVKWFFGIASVPIMAIALVYIVAVSSARFDDTDEGTGGSALQYAGQSYLNFCYFYDHHNEALFYPEREIPVISYLVLHKGYGDVKMERSAKEGFFIGVFATHVGAWILDMGKAGGGMLTILYAVLVTMVIRRYNRRTLDVGEMLMLFTLANVPLFGIFYYRFHSFIIALQYVFAGLLFLLYRFDFVITFGTEDKEKAIIGIEDKDKITPQQ